MAPINSFEKFRHGGILAEMEKRDSVTLEFQDSFLEELVQLM
jgi:hypothetical protein